MTERLKRAGRLVEDRRDLVAVAIVVAVAVGRLVLVATDASFSLFLLIAAVAPMPTIWAIKHNAIHRPVFASDLLDRSFLLVLGLVTGSSTTGTRIVHCAIHHRHNNGPDDWTAVDQAPAFSWRLLRVAAYPLVIVPRLIRARTRYLATRPDLRRRVAVETAGIAIVVIAAAITAPVAAVFYVIVPIVAGQWFLIAMNYLQHGDGVVGHELEHTTNDTGRLFNLVLLNLGYHAAHHLDPELHWTELPALHERAVAGSVCGRYLQPSFARRLAVEVVMGVERRPRPQRGRGGARRAP